MHAFFVCACECITCDICQCPQKLKETRSAAVELQAAVRHPVWLPKDQAHVLSVSIELGPLEESSAADFLCRVSSVLKHSLLLNIPRRIY